MAQHPDAEPERLELDPERGLAIIDVDEVLALFVQGFDRYLRGRGYELRMTSFALFGNLYAAEASEPAAADVARRLFEDFFSLACGELEPAPGAAAALADISRRAQIVIFTNAPAAARPPRERWLRRHGMSYPLIFGAGPKGPTVASLARRVRGPVMFVDDLILNLDSVAEAAPEVARFQLVADPAVRRLAPTSPERHRLVLDWPELQRLSAALFGA